MRTLIFTLVLAAKWMAGALFMAVFGLNVIQVALRYMVGITWLWVPDLLRLMFVWMVFLGATVLYAWGGHLTVDFLVQRLPPKGRQAAAAAVEGAAIAFFVVLFVKGIEITEKRMRVPFDTWDIPTGYAYMAIAVAAVLMTLIAAQRLAGHVRALLKGETGNVQGD